MTIKEKIDTVKSRNFTVSYSGFDGCILDNHDLKIRCFIERGLNFIRFSKYFLTEEDLKYRVDQRFDPEFLKEECSIELIEEGFNRLKKYKNLKDYL